MNVVAMPTARTLYVIHQRMLDASAISPDVVQERGYRTVTKKSELKEYGFGESQRRIPALLIPIHGVNGNIVSYQIRPNEPRVNAKGKPVKYETPAGSRMVLDVPPRVRSKLGDPKMPLWITEGAKKADAAVSAGLVCVALLGVWNWRGSNAEGGKVALPDWDLVALNGRDVFIAFDSDVVMKPEVQNALVRLTSFLQSRKATVHRVLLPSGESGTKVGLDDYLATGHSVDDLLACVRPESAFDSTNESESHYEISKRGLVWNKPTKEGSHPVALTNFSAVIASDIERDDGVEITRAFEIEAELGESKRNFTVSASAFAAMNWPIENLGSNAVLYAGQSIRDNARAAIQILSKPSRRRIYAHTGWREIDGGPLYLHAGGAIGASGTNLSVTVELPGELARMQLPTPPVGDALIAVVQASLRLLALGPERVMVPLLAATYRSVLGPADCSVFLVGETGEGKTEIATRAMQHFGAGFRREHPPASWMSTGNALEVMAFTAKDALLLVDDFCPTGSNVDVQKFHREADRILRAQGNRSGRGRLSSDGSLRVSKPPRGLILSTGEDMPRGHSLRARCLIVEVQKGDIDFGKLGAAQEEGANGLYASAMAGYLQWLAGRLTTMQSDMPAALRSLRNAASASAQHRRTAGIVADLYLGLQMFLGFAESVGAIDANERKNLEGRAWSALTDLAEDQADHHGSSEPTTRFLELLRSAVGSGVAYVAATTGGEPRENPEAWGWRQVEIGAGDSYRFEWRPQGNCIGWLDGEQLYLDRDASYRACNTAAGAGGEGLTVSATTLVKRMAEHGLLASKERGRESHLVRVTIEGKRRPVLHLHANRVLEREIPVAELVGELGSVDDGKGETPEMDVEVTHVPV